MLSTCQTIQCPHVPEFEAIDRFKGQALHTFDYKNASQFNDVYNPSIKPSDLSNRKKKFLVVGCGNSAIEIAGEIKLHDMEHHDVTLLVRNGRHFTKGKTKHRFESTLDRICSPSPFSEVFRCTIFIRVHFCDSSLIHHDCCSGINHQGQSGEL